MRRISTGALVIGGVIGLIALIAVITYIAWTVINRTVLEQIQTADAQLVTSLTQQTQSQLNSLNGNASALSIQEDVRAIAQQNRERALAIFEQEIVAFPEETIISITRFNFQGEPQYAYPPDYNELIEAEQEYYFDVPSRLLEISTSRQGEISDIPIETYRVPNRDGGSALLLIAPVDSANRRIGFVAYELNLEPILAQILEFISFESPSQLWVLDAVGNPLYQALPEPDVDTINEFSATRLFAAREPQRETYSVGDEDFNATFARTQALNQSFVVFLSRSQSEAQQGVTDNVISIFGVSTAAMLAALLLGSVFFRQVNSANRERSIADQRRETARTLLEVSRALNSSLDINAVLQRIMREISSLVEHDSSSVLLLDDDGLRVAASSGDSPESDAPGNVLRLEEARAAREVVANEYPIVINDTAADPRWTSMPGENIRSWMGLPLRVRNQLVGVLNINSNSVGSFMDADVELAEGFADQAGVAIQNAQLHELEVKRIEQELSIARGIQESLLPDQAPVYPYLEIASTSQPASQVSGDYFQFIPLPDGRLGIAIGDVQGKGIPAALMMAVIMTALRDESTRYDNPAELLQALNERLLERMQRNHMNSALTIATYDPRKQEFEIANGGMVQPYLRPPGDDVFDFVQIGGYPLGISGSMKYTTKQLDFGPGSLLVMLSDGVLEAQNKEDDFFGFERIEALLNDIPSDASAGVVLQAIQSAVSEHLGSLAPQDDTTILVIRAAEETEEQRTFLENLPPIGVNPLLDENQKNIELNLPSILGYEKVAMGTAGALAREIGFDDERVADIQTAVAETCMNAIEHGNSEEVDRFVNVALITSPEAIEIRVQDHGLKQLPKELPPPGQGDMRGWGLFFMKNLVDHFEINHLPDGQNEVTLICYLEKKETTIQE